ncbi:MAG: hypothetical protein M3480_02630, partial [Verrucomicrobiota bacterium]|nr:hypothetical protein [Verrucomicrobiota bacterium]
MGRGLGRFPSHGRTLPLDGLWFALNVPIRGVVELVVAPGPGGRPGDVPLSGRLARRLHGPGTVNVPGGVRICVGLLGALRGTIRFSGVGLLHVIIIGAVFGAALLIAARLIVSSRLVVSSGLVFTLFLVSTGSAILCRGVRSHLGPNSVDGVGLGLAFVVFCVEGGILLRCLNDRTLGFGRRESISFR